MAIIGLLLILAAGAVTAGAIYDGGESATIEVFGLSADTTVGGVFVVGLATMLIFFVGVWLLFSSMGRSRRKRQERKEARQRQKQSVSEIEEERSQLRAENERLNEQLASRRGAATTAGAGAGTTHDGTHDSTHDGTPDSTDDHGAATSTATAAPAARPHVDEGRPQHVEGDRVVDHTTDLTSHDESAASSSGRHRDET